MRYWTLRDLVGASEEEVEASRQQALQSEVAKEVFRQQKPEGHWESPGNMHAPHYTSTVYHLILLPGINDNGHLEMVARTVKNLGVYIQNITPLIPLGRFKHLEAPSCDALRWTRFRCEQIIRQFRLCRQCRADAVGIPGKAEL